MVGIKRVLLGVLGGYFDSWSTVTGSFSAEAFTQRYLLYLDRCGACQALAADFEEFAKEAEDAKLDIRIGEVDIDANPVLVNRWTILKLPTLMHVLPNREGGFHAGRYVCFGPVSDGATTCLG